MNIPKHLLVPTDFEAPSVRAMELAVELAQRFEATITLAHFWEIPSYPYLSGWYSSVDFVTPVSEAATQMLEQALASVRQKLPTATAVCRMGAPWQEIVKAITEVGADLVVMGTHGRRGISHALIGSVAEKVVRLSPVPVLTVPSSPGA